MMDLGAILRKLRGGETVSLLPGTYAGGEVLRAKKVTLQALGGLVVIRGGDHYALKLDGAHGARLKGNILLTASLGHGLMGVNTNEVELDGITADLNAVNGILTGNCSAWKTRNVKARKNSGGHGYYHSEHGGAYDLGTLDDPGNNVFTGNGRCNFQANAHPGRASGLTVVGNDLRNAVNACCQVAGVTGGLIAGNLVGGAKVDVVLWTDQGGKDYAPHDIDCRQQAGRYLVSKWSLKTCRLPPGVTPGRPEGE